MLCSFESRKTMFPLQDSNQARNFPLVNYLILLANLLFFLLELALPESILNAVIDAFGLVPSRFLEQFNSLELMTIFSSMFLHAGWLHLISNMWALHIFGDNVEDRMGHLSYLFFYFACGAIAALSQVIMGANSALPMIGASGALAGVLGAYLVIFPRAKVITWIPLFLLPIFVEIPAIVFLGAWFLSQFFTGLGSVDSSPLAAEGGVAWWAHVGGFIGGIILVKVFQKQDKSKTFYPDEYYPW